MKVIKHPANSKNPARPGQSSYITKDALEVIETGRHKTELPEKFGFVVCGHDSDIEGVPGVIIVHLSKKLIIHNMYQVSNTEVVVETSRGMFTVESQVRVYSGPTPPEVQKETMDDLWGQEYIAKTGDYDCEFPSL